MSRYYPVFLNLENRLCVVIGGGAVAERKTAGLLEAGVRVRLVSPELTDWLRQRAEAAEIEYRCSRYSAGDLEGAALAFAATSVRSVNALVASDAASLGIPANIADAPEESAFIVPSSVRRGEFCLSISTGGNNPILAGRIASEMEQRFSASFGAYIELLGQVRETVKGWTDEPAARRRAAAAVLDREQELCELLAAGRAAEASALARTVARAAAGL